MKNGVASGHGFFKGCGVAQVSRRGVGIESLKVFQITGWAHEQAEIRALIGEDACDMRAKESCGASDECEHSAVSIQHAACLVNGSNVEAVVHDRTADSSVVAARLVGMTKTIKRAFNCILAK
jgi:hypothetical protein